MKDYEDIDETHENDSEHEFQSESRFYSDEGDSLGFYVGELTKEKKKAYKEFRSRGSKASNEWYTPKEYIESVRKVLGEIEVDPASSDKANLLIGAEIYYTKETNGLDKDWLNKDGLASKLFLNPPYGGQEKIWIPKLINQYNTNKVKEAIILVGAKTERKWFQDLWSYTLCFTDFRIHFIPGEDNDSGKDNPTSGNVFAYLGDRDSVFAQEFEQYGHVVYKKHTIDDCYFLHKKYEDLCKKYEDLCK
jgi:phage N-6-adenine-methyltransferase